MHIRCRAFLSIFSLLILLSGCNRTEKNESVSEKKGAGITFKEQNYDFGQLNEGDVVEHDFEFTNTGEVPLEIIDVQVQCGCTVASRPDGLIGVGRSDKITVRFNSSGKLGMNRKLVSVLANTAEPIKPIEFTATVIPAKTESLVESPN